MPSLTLKIPYRKNEGLVMSPSELLETYFYGVPIRVKSGEKMSPNVMRDYIKAAQEEVEKRLNIKIANTRVTEEKDFHRNDWQNWGYIRTTYPVKEAFKLDGFIQSTRQIEYPASWLSARQTSDGELYHRHIYLVPNQDAATTGGEENAIVYQGITPHLGFMGNQTIPNYWKMEYLTGFDQIPMDLWNFIGKLASINIFHIMGDLILGAGIATQSIGVDGLSQSISTTSSATNAGYGARIQGYLKDLKEAWPELKNYYKGFTVTSM